MTYSSHKHPDTPRQCMLYCLICGVLMMTQAAADDSTGPAEMLTAMTDRVLLEIRKNPAILDDEDGIRNLADGLILPNIDFRAASRWVLGKHWRTASVSQRDAFVREFRALLVNTYLHSLKKYQEHTIRILAARPGQPQGRAVVDAEVIQPDGPLIKFLFRLHQPKSDWLVYDIVIEGISLVATHRSGFATEIQSKGLDSLIAHLVMHNASGASAAGVAEQ